MIPNDLKRDILLPHLRGQFERGLPVLFTGAGFSAGCSNLLGEQLPSSRKLRELLWNLCFPGKPFNESSSLPDLYSFAHIRHPNQLKDLLSTWLTVHRESIPDYYRIVFSMPWSRSFTLNIDDLASAVSTSTRCHDQQQ